MTKASNQNLTMQNGTYLKCYNCDAEGKKSNKLYFMGEDSEGRFLASAYYCRKHYEEVAEKGLAFKTITEVVSNEK